MPIDFKPSYTTKLTPDEEVKFRDWALKNAPNDLDNPEAHYDLRGFWKENPNFSRKPGEHLTDKFKQPGHPTFSVESKYAVGRNDAGRWEGEGKDAVFIPAASKNIDFKPEPVAKMPDASKMVKSGISKLYDWGTTSLTGIHEPTMEEWQKDPKGAAWRAGVAGTTTPVSIAGELLGGAGLIAKRAGLFGKAAPEVASLIKNPAMDRARSIIEAYEGAGALKGKTPKEIQELADKLDPLKYSQSETPLKIDIPKTPEVKIPDTVYHGTVKDFHHFDDNILKDIQDYPAHYFTDNPEIASIYAGEGPGANVRPAKIKLKNPFDIDKNKALYDKLVEQGPDEFVKKLKEMGHDGITYHDPGDELGKPHRVFGVFSSEQVKPKFGEEPIKLHKGGSAYDDQLVAQLGDEIKKTRNLEFVDPDIPPNERLRQFAEQDRIAAAAKKPKLRVNTDGTFTNLETGEVIEAPKNKKLKFGPREVVTANDVNINSGDMPNVKKGRAERIRTTDPTEGRRILAQMVGDEPPTVTPPRDEPFVSVGPMATEQGGLGFGKGPRTLEHVAPNENVAFQSVGEVPGEQASMGFGKDAPPPNFKWGDWWSGTSKGQKALDIYGVGNRAIQSSFDISWPLRQGRKIIHTKAWREGVKEGIKALRSEGNYEQAMKVIKSDPLFDTAQKSGVDFTELTSNTAKREEQFQNPLAENIPFFGRAIRASGRSYTVMGNKARLEFFKSVIKDPNVDKVAAADLVNTLTGRAKLPTKNLERAAPALNQFLYSPKALYSNIKVLNPYTYVKAPKGVRKEYVKSALMMMGTTYAVNNIAEAAGAKVTWNPTSSDFGKIVIGNTHLDPMGGVQQPLVLAARVITGKKTSSTGKVNNLRLKGYGQDTAFDVMADFGRSKLAPWPGAIINTLSGQDPVGNDTNAGKELLKLYTPMIGQDLLEVAQDNPELAPIVAGLVGVGVGQATYKPKKGKGGGLFSSPKIALPKFKMPSIN